MDENNFEKAYNQVKELIKNFEAYEEDYYLRETYSEADVRKEFIDKFFIALGWDVNHDKQNNPYEQEVKIELSQEQENEKATKRADYAFFLSPDFENVQFFVEAKKPSKSLKGNRDYYFQTIKYGWNAGTGISILTDFEEIIILDCRYEPKLEFVTNLEIKIKERKDNYIYKEFRERDKFAEFYELFSHAAVKEGKLKDFIKNLPPHPDISKKIKYFSNYYQDIDESFLAYIDEIRLKMAQAFYETNSQLDNYELTEATQRTIDRLIFIRFLEDKQIEPENILNKIVKAKNSWEKFREESKRLNIKYNGIVFKQHLIDKQDFKDVDIEIFKEIVSDLESSNTPYDFNYIPIHILGNIYERFLGKTIIIENKQAKIEMKPEIRKAGGVFYTPQYIVNYIVENTIGKLIKGKKPKEIAEMKFADIACGSGSFLIGIYDYLLRYHTDYYNKPENKNEAKKSGCIKVTNNNNWTLSIKQKQNILLNNIFGVDIDLQATEVTQVSLFLKLLEDETMATANEIQVLYSETILPNMNDNIKCGNSLIGMDVFDGTLEFGKEEMRKLNPFDFELAFPKIFNRKEKGFDAIIGNPPYVSIKDVGKLNLYLLNKNYILSNKQPDLFTFFIEKSLKLIKNDGFISLIIPDSIIDRSNYIDTRKILIENGGFHYLLVLNNVFTDASVGSLVFVFQKNYKGFCNYIKSEKDNFNSLILKNEIFKKNENFNFLFIDVTTSKLLNKLYVGNIYLKEFTFMGRGEEISKNSDIINENNIATSRPFISGDEISRYLILNKKKYIQIKYIKKKTNLYKNKIVVRQVGSFINASYDNYACVTPQSVYTIYSIDKNINNLFILGIINSSLINFIFQNKYNTKKLFPRILLENLKQLPFPNITYVNRNKHDLLVSLVDKMLIVKKQESEVNSELEKNLLIRQIDKLENDINNLVYQLYELNDNEIKIIES